MDHTKKNSSPTQEKINFGSEEQKILEEKLTRVKHTPESIRLAYYTLLASAIDHRKKFIDEDIKVIKDTPEPTAEQALRSIKNNAGLRKMTAKTARKAHHASTDIMVKKINYFYTKSIEEVNTITGKMQPDIKAGFERTVQFITDATEELLFARDIQEVLGMLRMYNAGELDVLFENSRKITNDLIAKENEKTAPGDK